jgi:cytochrome o ubiquinol oxidase subunit 2
MPGKPDLAPIGERLPRSSHRMRAAAWRCALVALAPAALIGCEPGILQPQGPVGLAAREIMTGSLAIMLAIVVPTIAATLGFAWWFRASNKRAVHLPEFEYDGRIELVVWSIPFLTVTLLGGVAWIGSHALDPARPLESQTPPLEVQVVSLDWRWLFIYPDAEQRIASVNELVIPVGRPVHFAITSASVMNAFFIPQLGSMIYAMNGMATQLNLRADAAGTFRGLSSQYSGDGFAGMRFTVRAVPPDEFTAWVAATRRDGPALDATSYAALTRQSTDQRAFTFREADPMLFHQIVTQALPPGPGPLAGRPLPSVSPRTEP